MKHNKNLKTVTGLAVATVAAGVAGIAQARQGGLVEDTTATLQARNYYFSRDFSDIVGASRQSKAEEWAQGFILKVNSGYTPGPVGFGVDVLGQLGIKLDSSPDRVNTGLLPTHGDGRAADDYGRIGAALKMRLSETELKVGELTPNLPVLTFSDIRLLPPTYQGASLVSQEIPGLILQAGQFRSGSLLNEAGDGPMRAKLGHVPRLGGNAETDRFNYAGADYAFNDTRTSLGAWYAQLEDIYNQRFYSLKHSEPVGNWVLGASLGFYDSKEDGKQLLGDIDNQAAFALLSVRHGGHTLYVGYQAMFGDDAFPRVFNNVTPLGNEVPTFEFASADERSWQLRYDYNFAGLGVPGLVAGVRYIQGDNVDAQATNRGGPRYEGKEWERDLDLGYEVQNGALRGLGVRVRNAVARSNYRTDINENRLIFNYTWTLL
ncbi:Porin-like protein NicP precursor [Pseudomonas oleovorans subsp. oleovorans]|uniref:Porin n=1 Tax=Ectopseudomonas oleovorans TaxID=301 RepID=A0A379JTJ4_ECTOL|nr:OprD family porin [Pseudomonas oleovorans]OWK49292.1 Porin-like protein NicP precursor [Pseudomonas oleovorans subsp. oleovorans]SUD51656.1 porin [Pseudomonas oleovorans]